MSKGVTVYLLAGAGELGMALQSAADQGRTAVVALLLDRGADVHFGDDAALWCAATRSLLETATLLLQRGATALNSHLDTAVLRGHHAVADLLRAHGAV